VKRALLLVGLAGCKAESVGVEVPRGGPDAIRMEDLRRDAFLLEGQKSSRQAGVSRPAAAWTSLTDRLRQMKTVPAFGRSYRSTPDVPVVCSRKDGRSDTVLMVAVEDDPVAPARSTAGIAMLISLAKAWDTRRPPAKTILFCAWEGADGFAAFASAPPVPIERIEQAWVLGGLSRKGAHERWLEPVPLSVAERVDGLDFVALQASTRVFEAVIREAVSASP